ncbi:low molecular weight protein-tyrosine-phosphatase [Alistipes ihumii]|uniref:low molecular weight protein-tyrosine-phosphatase n=1 Tax=Alistipes ihumii TaxID=1470347 RepID=UPI002673F386|nr:low molecular weight protein-tyrosine-phosphatase [Alistipes ihumii]MEE1419146.1 low molecular weight protein-tyrosine-phosphatase [Alistipes ihumii]
MNMNEKYKILFVCLGNICRSPAAEAVFRDRVEKAGLAGRFEIDSAGLIGYHAGDGADPRMKAHAARRGYRLDSISRPVAPEDFDRFDRIVGMDDRNLRELRRLGRKTESGAAICKMTDFCRKSDRTEVPDPYYGGDAGFELVLDLIEDASDGLLERIRSEREL